MIYYTTKLKEEIERNIRAIESAESDILLRVYSTAKMIEELLGQLKEFIVQYEFRSEDEEILFFKEIKPRIFCYLLFYLKVYQIELNRPMGSMDLQAGYFNRELEHISHYIGKRLDFYRYYRSGSTNRDHLYFKRGVMNWNEQYIDGFYFERDPMFSSGCDFTVVKIHSCDMLQVFLREELDQIDRNRLLLSGTPDAPAKVIRWSDKKALLVSIIYSLDTLRSFEGGTLSLRKLQEYVEEHFDIRLGNLARAFMDIRMLQNPAMHIDVMREALLRRVKETDERTHSHYAKGSSFTKTRNPK